MTFKPSKPSMACKNSLKFGPLSRFIKDSVRNVGPIFYFLEKQRNNVVKPTFSI